MSPVPEYSHAAAAPAAVSPAKMLQQQSASAQRSSPSVAVASFEQATTLHAVHRDRVLVDGQSENPLSFLSRVTAKDNASHGTLLDSYRDLFDYASEDVAQDSEGVAKRVNVAVELANKYYDLATDFYEYGWGQSFHFAHQYAGEPLMQAIARHEHFLALKLGLKPGMLVAVSLFPYPLTPSEFPPFFLFSLLD
jgi:hypothetical protein